MSTEQQEKRYQPKVVETSSLAARVVAQALTHRQSLVRMLMLGEVIGERPAERLLRKRGARGAR